MKFNILLVVAILSASLQSRAQEVDLISSYEIMTDIRNDSELSSLYSDFQVENLHTTMDKELFILFKKNPLLRKFMAMTEAGQNGFLDNYALQKDAQSLRITPEFIAQLELVGQKLTANADGSTPNEEVGMARETILNNHLTGKTSNADELTAAQLEQFDDYLLEQKNPELAASQRALRNRLKKLEDENKGLRTTLSSVEKELSRLNIKIDSASTAKLALIYRTFVRTAKHLAFSDEQIKNAEFRLEDGTKNAFTVSANSNRLVFSFFSGLLDPSAFSIAEIRAVMAHELGHIKAKHTSRRIVMDALLTAYFIKMKSVQAGGNLAEQLQINWRNERTNEKRTTTRKRLANLMFNGHNEAGVAALRSIQTVEGAHSQMVQQILKMAASSINGTSTVFNMYYDLFSTIARNVTNEYGKNSEISKYYTDLTSSVQGHTDSFVNVQTTNESESKANGFLEASYVKFANQLESILSQQAEKTSDGYAAGLSRHKDIATTFMKLDGKTLRPQQREAFLEAYEAQAKKWLEMTTDHQKATLSGGSHPGLVLRVFNILSIDRFVTTTLANRFLALVHFLKNLDMKLSIMQATLDRVKAPEFLTDALKDTKPENIEKETKTYKEQLEKIEKQVKAFKAKRNRIFMKIYKSIFQEFDPVKRNPRLINLLQYELVAKQGTLETLQNKKTEFAYINEEVQPLRDRIATFMKSYQTDPKSVTQAQANQAIKMQQSLLGADEYLEGLDFEIKALETFLKETPKENSLLGALSRILKRNELKTSSPEADLILDAHRLLADPQTKVDDLVVMQLRLASRNAKVVDIKPRTKLPISRNGIPILSMHQLAEIQRRENIKSCQALFSK